MAAAAGTCQTHVRRAITHARTCFCRQLLVGGLDLLQGSQLLLHRVAQLLHVSHVPLVVEVERQQAQLAVTGVHAHNVTSGRAERDGRARGRELD